MTKLTLVYSVMGTVAVGGVGIGGYIYSNRNAQKTREQKKESISEVLTRAGKMVLSTEAGASNKHSSEWDKRKSAYANASSEELITDLDNSNPETKIEKSSSVDVEKMKMKKWCKRYLEMDFSSSDDAIYKRVLKWCTKEAE